MKTPARGLSGGGSTFTTTKRSPIVPILIVLGTFYALLFQSYRAYEIDNAWYLSFSRNLWVNKYGKDFFLNGIFPDGMGGTVVFGRLPAIFQGAILSHFGWRPMPAALLSICLVLAGLAVWYCFLRNSGLAQKQSCALIFALGLTEPFVGMAERFRYEPFSFLIMATTFWMASTGRLRMALILGLLALEIQPAAILIFASLFLFLIRDQCPPRFLIHGFLYAIVCFACMYIPLHPHVLGTLWQTDWHRAGTQMEFGGFVRAYFVDRRRHLPEFVLFMGAGLIYFKHRAEAPAFVNRMAEAAALVCITALLMRWATSAYMVFFFPFALVVAQWCLTIVLGRTWRSPWAIFWLFGVLMLPQYAALTIINWHEGYRNIDLQQVATAISNNEQRLHLDDANIQIMGDYSLWYAHPARYRALTSRTQTFIPSEDMYLCFDGPIRPPAMVDTIARYCDLVGHEVHVHQVDSLSVRGHLLHILVPDNVRFNLKRP